MNLYKISFRAKYIFALILIAVFAILVYSSTLFLVKDQGKYARCINISGKERMLVVKMLNYVNNLSHNYTQNYKKALEETIIEFEEIELTLKNKGYYFAQQNKKEYISYIKYFLDTFEETSNIEDKKKHVLTNEVFEKMHNILVTEIDTFVLLLQKESEQKIQNIVNIETILIILLLFVLLIEAFYIFLPAEKEIRTKTIALKKSNENLEERISLEIKKNQEQTSYMLQQSRLAQMGEMISMIAHQWRQPLASISAISGTLTLDLMLDNFNNKFFKERLEAISELTQHLSVTIDDFRTFFKNDKKEEVSEVKSIINESISIIGQTLKNKNINLIVNCEDQPQIKSYTNEIKQVLLNLMKNSEDILLDKKIKEPKIWINVHKTDTEIYISIEDNAGGIPKDITEQVFDPYFSTKKEKDGTGLGLYMSKIIIQEHCRGKLLVENTSNGALFTIVLPIYFNGEET